MCIPNIYGTVFVDVNNNSVPDSGEPRLSGVEIKLTGPSTNLSTLTNPSGTYYYDNLASGTYQSIETQPAGYTSLSPDTVMVVIVQCPSLAAIVDFREIELAPTPTPTNTPTLTPTPTITPTPTPTPQTAPTLSIEVANVPSASSMNVGDTYWYDVTVMNTSPSASLTRIVLIDQYNPTIKQCVVAVSSSSLGCSLNALVEQWECDIPTNVNPNATFSVRFFYQAANNCTLTQNANTTTAVGYQGASSSPPVSASAYVTIN